jgi:hypothetical protein
MKNTNYAALLRGFNVGGKNIIKMKALYFKRLKEKSTKTYLTKIVGTPIVPVVYDGLPARIKKCVAFLGLANCGCSEPWEWSAAE